MSDEYDPQTCVTAEELRAVGLELPESIPDCAWVLRGSIHFALKDTEQSDLKDLFIGVTVEFCEPFRWISVNFTIEGAQNEGDVV